ncbi:MAG: hypothetical protein AAF589_08265 [Planctomycetota bacterium]
MRSRFPLLLKKRGRRRTGAPQWGHSGELLYHGIFVVVGVVACWWHIANVLVPDWSQAQATADFVPATCEVTDWQVRSRAKKLVAVCCVRVVDRQGDDEPADGTESDDRAAGRLIEIAIGRPVKTRGQAERLLSWYTVGETVPCWIDPGDADRVILDRGVHAWRWLVLTIPVSLVVLGVFGGCRTLLKAGVSNERRHSVAQQAGRFDPFSASRVSIAIASALPPTHDVDDSPGVKHRFRLPIEGGASWRLVGMTVMCVAWNVLVGFFLVGVVADHWNNPRPNWALTIVVTPLAFAGAWLAYSLLRDAWAATGVGVTQVEIANHPLILGQTSGGVVFQAGQFRARFLTVSLVCDEIATYCEGTDTRTSVEEVYRQKLYGERRFRVETDRPYEQAFTFMVPEDAMHSFVSPHNEVRWSIEVRAAPMRWPEFRRRFRLCVYPANLPPPGDRYDSVEIAAGAPA